MGAIAAVATEAVKSIATAAAIAVIDGKAELRIDQSFEEVPSERMVIEKDEHRLNVSSPLDQIHSPGHGASLGRSWVRAGADLAQP